MFQVFKEEPMITFAVITFMVVSILLRIFLGAVYAGMIRESDNMATTKNKLLKQCKLKFANCYQLNNGVSNTSIFVDKFLNRLAIGPFSFETLYHLSGQSMLFAIIIAGIGTCKAIVKGRTIGDVLPYYIISCMGLYLYFSVSGVADLRGKKRVLKVNLIDYLENHLSARITVTQKDLQMLYGEDAAAVPTPVSMPEKKRTVEVMPIVNRNKVQPQPDSMALSPDFMISDEELEALIKEFC